MFIQPGIQDYKFTAWCHHLTITAKHAQTVWQNFSRNQLNSLSNHTNSHDHMLVSIDIDTSVTHFPLIEVNSHFCYD